MANPVFYDPRRARWKRLRRLFDVLGLTITVLVVFFVYTALRSEPLPELLLPTLKRPYHALKENEKQKAKEKRKRAAELRGHRKSKKKPSQVQLNAEEGIPRPSMFPGTRPAFHPCANMPASLTCFIRSGSTS
jgi:hypothetical protein